MEIYSSTNDGRTEKIKFLGLQIYKKVQKEDGPDIRYLAGLWRTKIHKYKKKYYFCGIQIYTKDHINSLKNIDDLNYLKNKCDKLSVLDNLEKRIVYRLAYINQRQIIAARWHQKAFAPYKAAFRGKSVVLMGAGPTVNYFEPIKDAIYVGCNRAFLYDKVKFDFLFAADKVAIEKWYEEFFGYRKDECIKFISDQNLGPNFQIPENLIPLKNVHRYITFAGIEPVEKYYLDISVAPLHNAATVSIQALQFILYTQPEKIYIVGIDCTNASFKHFICKGEEYDSALRGDNLNKIDLHNIKCYNYIKKFIDVYYPYTEIISVNPVNLKGVFKDVYTKSYLAEHPEIAQENPDIIEDSLLCGAV